MSKLHEQSLPSVEIEIKLWAFFEPTTFMLHNWKTIVRSIIFYEKSCKCTTNKLDEYEL